MASKDFNYQVALKEGLKSLEQGRLRQAEQSFKYLVNKFPGAEGGYRGLAKVHFEQEDRAGSLRVLREGAAALIKSGERSGAIGLLRQAVALDPRDLTTHRRLAAALALTGDTDASVQEYARFIRDLRDSGESERAKSEVVWAKGQLRGVSGVSTLDAIADGAPSRREEAAEVVEPAEETTRFSDREGGTALRPQASDQWSTPRVEPVRSFTPPPAPPSSGTSEDPWAAPPSVAPSRSYASEQPVREITLENDPWASAAVPTPSIRSWTSDHQMADDPEERVEAVAEPELDAEPEVAEAAVEEQAAPPPEPVPDTWMAAPENGEPKADVDPVGVEAAAARYMSTRDPRAAAMALEAARHYIKEGNVDSASDLLLQLIAAGIANHDSQRLLVDVVRTLGKREVAKTKCRLLARALVLDGRNDLAAEVEALALTD
ncbi:MAG: bacterial transcriptional activator domain-containing protein [Chloroflexota bacterium]|nr:bacterial transcriptional activator domain-containing protein [Chloroflexota bacterium]